MAQTSPRNQDSSQFTRGSVGYALSGLCLIGFLTLAEVIPVTSRVRNTPQYFTARLVLAPVWGQIRNWPTWYFAFPAGVLFILALLPVTSSATRNYLPSIPKWISPVSLMIGLGFFPIASTIHNVQRVGYLWSLLFFVWAGANGWVKQMDYFWATVVGSIFWDMGAGIQGVLRSLHGLPEPYWAGAPPIFVLSVDVALVFIATTLWLRRVDPGKFIDHQMVSKRKRRLADDNR